MRLSVSHPLRPRRRSLNTARVADAFGLDVDEADRLTLAENLPVPAGPGRVTLFAGPSGSGKSSLLRAAAARLDAAAVPVVRADRLDPPDAPLADALAGLLPGGFAAASALLSKCGLAEPRLLLRTPGELSDGQRFRFSVPTLRKPLPGRDAGRRTYIPDTPLTPFGPWRRPASPTPTSR